MADTKMARRNRTIENLKSNNFIILMRNGLELCQKGHTGIKNVLRKYFITVLKIYQDIMKTSKSKYFCSLLGAEHDSTRVFTGLIIP